MPLQTKRAYSPIILKKFAEEILMSPLPVSMAFASQYVWTLEIPEVRKQSGFLQVPPVNMSGP